MRKNRGDATNGRASPVPARTIESPRCGALKSSVRSSPKFVLRVLRLVRAALPGSCFAPQLASVRRGSAEEFWHGKLLTTVGLHPVRPDRSGCEKKVNDGKHMLRASRIVRAVCPAMFPANTIGSAPVAATRQGYLRRLDSVWRARLCPESRYAGVGACRPRVKICSCQFTHQRGLKDNIGQRSAGSNGPVSCLG